MNEYGIEDFMVVFYARIVLWEYKNASVNLLVHSDEQQNLQRRTNTKSLRLKHI